MSASLLLRPRTSVADDFGWLQKLCENLGEAMCDFLASHQKVEAKVQSVAEARYSEWYPSQPAFSLLMPFELGTDAGELVVVVEEEEGEVVGGEEHLCYYFLLAR